MSSHLYIHSLTRKMVDSVLYLTSRPETNISADSQWFAVIAATLAMSAYMIPLIAIQFIFGLDNNTTFWVLLAIILYIIKDRVKESIRDTLRRSRIKKMAHRTLVISNDEDIIGKSYEKLSYPLQNELPRELLDIRFTGPHADLQKSLGEYEHIQYYQKLQQLKKLPANSDTLLEIIRMDLNSWLLKADGNQQHYSQYFDKLDEIKAEKILRTYHFHFLIRFGSSSLKHDELLRYHRAEGDWQHIRIVASRERILEIQPLPPVSIS